MLTNERQRLGPNDALQLTKGNQRPGKGHGPDGGAKAHFDQGPNGNLPCGPDIIFFRRIEGRRGNKDRRQAYQAVKAATNCGSAVISILRAINVPMAPPTTIPRMIHS